MEKIVATNRKVPVLPTRCVLHAQKVNSVIHVLTKIKRETGLDFYKIIANDPRENQRLLMRRYQAAIKE